MWSVCPYVCASACLLCKHVCMSVCMCVCASLCLCVCMSLCVSMCLYVCMLLFKRSCMLEDLGHQKVLYAPSTMLLLRGLQDMESISGACRQLCCTLSCYFAFARGLRFLFSRPSFPAPPSLPPSLSLYFLSLSLSFLSLSFNLYTFFLDCTTRLTEVLKHKFRQVRTWECSRTKPTSSVPTSRGPARFCTERVRQRDGLQSSRCIAHASVLHA